MNCGQFLNKKSYTLTKVADKPWGWLWNVTEYEVKTFGLLWQAADGLQVKPFPEYISDGCSTPPPMWNMPSLDPDRFLLTGLFHDGGCKYGGLLIKDVCEKEFTFRRLTRLDLDNYLRLWVGAEGGNAVQRWLYYRGVRMGAPFMRFPGIRYWDETEGPKPPARLDMSVLPIALA